VVARHAPPPRGDFRDFVLVSGEDPYAWKGTEELTFPFLRPEDPDAVKHLFEAFSLQ
jgi:hypothetical protein